MKSTAYSFSRETYLYILQNYYFVIQKLKTEKIYKHVLLVTPLTFYMSLLFLFINSFGLTRINYSKLFITRLLSQNNLLKLSNSSLFLSSNIWTKPPFCLLLTFSFYSRQCVLEHQKKMVWKAINSISRKMFRHFVCFFASFVLCWNKVQNRSIAEC